MYELEGFSGQQGCRIGNTTVIDKVMTQGSVGPRGQAIPKKEFTERSINTRQMICTFISSTVYMIDSRSSSLNKDSGFHDYTLLRMVPVRTIIDKIYRHH